MTAGPSGPGVPRPSLDADEALCARLRDLSLVEIDALVVGAREPGALISAFSEDIGEALGAARTRIAALRAMLGGADPLNVLDTTARQRGSDAGATGAERVRARLGAQAEAARSLARLSELAANLAPKLFEADRRR